MQRFWRSKRPPNQGGKNCRFFSPSNLVNNFANHLVVILCSSDNSKRHQLKLIVNSLPIKQALLHRSRYLLSAWKKVTFYLHIVINILTNMNDNADHQSFLMAVTAFRTSSMKQTTSKDYVLQLLAMWQHMSVANLKLIVFHWIFQMLGSQL